MDGCFERDDVKALQQVLALDGVSKRYPFLLRRAVERNPGSVKCVAFLMERGTTPSWFELSDRAPETVTTTQFTEMIKRGIVRVDSWRSSEDTFEIFDPLIEKVIEVGRYDLAQVLLEAGAPVDVGRWHRRIEGFGELGEFRCSRPGTPLLNLVEDLYRDADEEKIHETGLSLLRSLARASKAAGCFDWERPGCAPGQVTALGAACENRDVQVVRILVEEGGRVEGGGEGLRLPFGVFQCPLPVEEAARRFFAPKDAECAAILEELSLLEGVDLNAVRRDGHTPLSLACTLGMEQSVEKLLQLGVSPMKVKRPGRTSKSPMFEALRGRSESIVSLLIRWKADPNEVIVWGGAAYTVLQVAMGACLLAVIPPSKSLAIVLLQNGARCSLSLPPDPACQGAVSLCEVSPLLLACQIKESDAELLSLFCERGGANPNAGAMRTVIGAVHAKKIDAKKGIELLQALADAGGDWNMISQDGHGLLSVVCRRCMPEGVNVCMSKFLLEKGLAVGGGKGKGGRWRVPLVEAAARADFELVSLLLQWGADPNQVGLRDQVGMRVGQRLERQMSPLQVAMEREIASSSEMWDTLRVIGLLREKGGRETGSGEDSLPSGSISCWNSFRGSRLRLLSGCSWLAELISFERARGPLLLEIIREIPLEEAMEPRDVERAF
uniref:Uncharacterized protein n=1 Tax=Chromera velia CCMP2878 TaxID=1169474 RepID=A0A0G4F868_9ALVE|eukprot:Cvel_15737.t1-p1 / transcript=Cvel_15737.t1 / gene=Cvel_15737 / organism=Chromera_velia_CCMP2878 / gene_product=hypothetical protein / transcript_product=hypothetical protein / location=Cvel_scaffold1177:31253-33250(-) / protein_length=666 / sequence_SO=supercontig / SO=protein_coding / is_pseudo=false